MAVAPKRFEYLDQETNVAIAKFTSDMDSGIYNSQQNANADVSDPLSSLVNSSNQQSNANVAQKSTGGIMDLFSSSTRSTKGVGSSITDLGSLNANSLSTYFNNITGTNSGATKSLAGMAQSCSGRGLGYGLPGKPYKPSINCGAGKITVGTSGSGSSCNASSYGDLINKLTNGGYGAGFQDLQALLRKLMSLSGYGYNLGMCGVFGAVGQGMPTDVLSRASGSLMGTFGQAGNTNAMLDLAKNSVGLLPLATNPNAIEGWLGNYKKPTNVGQNGLVNLADRTTGGLELINPNWAKSEYDGNPSMCMASDYTDDLGETFNAKVTDRSYGPTELDDAGLSDDDFAMASLGSSDW